MADLTIPNGGFEDGDLTGWTVLSAGSGTPPAVTSVDRAPYEGTYGLAVRSDLEIILQNDEFFNCLPGDTVNVQCFIMPTRGSDRGTIRIWWYDAANNPISPEFTENAYGTPGHVKGTGGWRRSWLSNIPVPSAARKFKIGVYIRKYTHSAFSVDSFSGSIVKNRSITMISPEDGAVFSEGDTVPLQAEVGGTAPPVVDVTYYVEGNPVGSVAASPYKFNLLDVQAGVYEVFARMTLQGGATIDSDPISYEVVELPPPPELREYNASNAYTQLVLENFAGLGAQIPSTAQVTGLELTIDYKMAVLSRTKDLDNDSIENANDLVPFDLAQNTRIEAVLIDAANGYSAVGAPESVLMPITRNEFSIEETGVSDGKKWTVREQTSITTATLGGEDSLWGQTPISFPDFINRAIGIRFVPEVGQKPAYADSGDACYRYFIDSVRVKVFFDAGSVFYYFASPDKEHVIKATLTAAYVLDGNLRTGDASGILQLKPELEIIDGYQRYIGYCWTIHAAYPPTDANQIGVVPNSSGSSEPEGCDPVAPAMEYNGLPTQKQVKDNRSRYLFITENFYGDPALNSMYGVHGLPRAFAYNGDYFYKIYTQADAEKDSPRSIANHHGHLALGFHGGRVDISVIGEPYNYNGVDGASSWAFGDKVVGLLPLSGTILGVFGSKSIWGIAGTTVDNFSTQIISPNIGAIEYTICDMGFPVYANAYGIYTLSQTQQYGDYLGQPMSQDISPWLRPRLLRDSNSDKEVVCAFPVRSKNQYRLCFADGYVSSMTLNGQQIPTFSLQKYFIERKALDECFFIVPDPSWNGGSEFRNYKLVPEVLDVLEVDRFHVYDGQNYITFEYDTEAENPEYPWVADASIAGLTPNVPYDLYTVDENEDMVLSGCAMLRLDTVVEEVSVYNQPAIVPAAVSSELDHTGEERIHIAPYVEESIIDYDPGEG